MKLKVVLGYTRVDKHIEWKDDLNGKIFNSFNKVLDAIKLNEHVTVEDISTGNGYKEVWKDDEGEWIQKRWANDY